MTKPISPIVRNLLETKVVVEIAIQMKSSLSFVLGLGGFFSIAKSALEGLIDLPDISQADAKRRPSIKKKVSKLRWFLFRSAAYLTLLFIFAAFLYLGPLGNIDAKKLDAGTQVLSFGQQLAVWAIVLIAMLFLVLNTIFSIKQKQLRRLVEDTL